MEPNLSRLFPALQDLHLANDQVQVWQAWLDCPVRELTGYFDLLTTDEKVRASRFYFERDRSRFIVCRGLLRLILGAYLDIQPAQVAFCYGKHGKPALSTGIVGDHLEFNISHSNDLGVFAFCWGNPIGIDVEYVRPFPDQDRFAEHFFSDLEIGWIADHAGAEKQAGFFKIWTCKEAFFKVSGDGLTLPINQVVIDLERRQSVCLAAINGDPEQAARWKIVSFEPTSVYQAALAVEGQDWQVAIGWLSP